MDHYITGSAVRQLREKRGITQAQLADIVGVSNKAVSKWETGKGLPDITLIEPLAAALGISVPELLTGNFVTNKNMSSNMIRSKIYVCPVCGNIILAAGEAVINCCGISLPPLEPEEPDDDHQIIIDPSDGGYHVHLEHEMSKTHYISFMAYVTGGTAELVKLYPEGSSEARFYSRGHGSILICCNRHGLMKVKV
mgnify:CR=1 FL=1